MSIQLIEKDELSGELIINEEALDLIKNINETISVCIIVGPYREGKSFLINRLISISKNTFEVNNSDEPCTKGVWINKDPVSVTRDGKTFRVIFMDTECLDSYECDNTWNLKLLLFSLSISSIFIYNTKNTFTNDAFIKLSAMKETSKFSYLKKECPNFIWILRDYKPGHNLKPKDRFNKFFEKEDEINQSEKNLSEIRIRNQVRDVINNVFKELNCLYLSTPQHSFEKNLTQTLRSLNDIKFDMLKNQFIDEFELIRYFIYSKMYPKEIDNLTMNGQVFSEYLRDIVRSINSDEDINLKESYLKSVVKLSDGILKQQMDFYAEKMNDFFKARNSLDYDEFLKYEVCLYEKIIDFLVKNINETMMKIYIEKFEVFRSIKDSYGNLVSGKLSEYLARFECLASSPNENFKEPFFVEDHKTDGNLNNKDFINFKSELTGDA